MKKFLLILMFGSSSLLSTMPTFAGPPPFNRDETLRINNEDGGARSGGWQGRNFERTDEEGRVRERRMREERGVERLRQHRWQAGYVMPQHYRGDGYKVDYKNSNLPRPERNQQWYKINNDYILVNSDDNSIIRIMAF